MENHVIILGAGASASSGYPLADQLRLRVADPYKMIKSLFGERFSLGNAREAWEKFLPRFESDTQLLREGGFASVDEFCKLASGGEFSEQINRLKHLLRMCLCLHNPEEKYTESDYYPFIQRLFESDSPNLRNDTIVLTFNYDPYLEFLLTRAYKTRNHVARTGNLDPMILQRLNSGFMNLEDDSWTDREGFAFLKLHGTAVTPRNLPIDWPTYEEIFDPATKRVDLIRRLLSSGFSNDTVPILFPWETSIEFENPRATDHEVEQRLMANMERIWTIARKAVQKADRISFVGLSFHEYLNEGFRRLFERKSNPFLVTVASPDHKLTRSDVTQAFQDGLSPEGKALQMFMKCLGCGRIQIGRDLDPNNVIVQTNDESATIGTSKISKFVQRLSFKDFIGKM